MDLKNVTHLRFGHWFNQPIEGLDLKGVTRLYFGLSFNQPIEQLDLENVTHLTFGQEFDQPIEGLDLKNVTDLYFGHLFNQPIEGLDLENVKRLSFEPFGWFSYPTVIPSNLTVSAREKVKRLFQYGKEVRLVSHSWSRVEACLESLFLNEELLEQVTGLSGREKRELCQELTKSLKEDWSRIQMLFGEKACEICLDDLEEEGRGEIVEMLCCGELYHFSCLEDYAKRERLAQITETLFS